MQLTRFTDFGLRVLMYLTGLEGGQVVTIGEIAKRFDIPQNHLNKVVGRLSKLGWVAATPGRSGGLRLAVPAASLRLGDMLRELEGDSALVDCDKPPCALKGNCHLKRVLDLGQQEFYVSMNRHSLADLVQSPTAEAIVRMHIRPAASR